jgi:hypothetical protein
MEFLKRSASASNFRWVLLGGEDGFFAAGIADLKTSRSKELVLVI